MEKRIGTITIVISDKSAVKSVNDTLSQYSDGILSRQGLPLRDKGLNFINIVIEKDDFSCRLFYQTTNETVCVEDLALEEDALLWLQLPFFKFVV